MICSGVFLLFPGHFFGKMGDRNHGMMKFGRQSDDWKPHHGRGLRSDFHDDEFFAVQKKQMPSFVFDEDNQKSGRGRDFGGEKLDKKEL